MLKNAEKYNWWTPNNKKSSISIESKIGYLLKRGTLKELKQAVQEVGGEKIFTVWNETIHANNISLKKRNKVIEFFVKFHQHHLPK